MKTSPIAILILACLSIMPMSVAAQAERKERLKVRIVLLVPEGSEAPEQYRERLGSVATRTEKFFAEWMEHWDREVERTEFFEREADGSVQVTLVRARLSGETQGREALPEVRQLAINGAKKELELGPRANVLWWVFYYYPGVKGFRGGGNSKRGSAINAFPGGRGLIDQEAELAADVNNNAKLKGMIHEFGHALGLPHNGPRLELDFGNSLMGPVGPKFAEKVSKDEKRVHLNEVSAAMLWKHPLFKMEKPPQPQQPTRFNGSELKAKETANGQIKISGVIDSDVAVHSAIVFDSRNRGSGKFGDDYWARSYVGKVNDEGKFSVVVTHPRDSGKIFLSFCLENGINTADGKRQTLQKSVVEIGYQGRPGKRKFKFP